MPPLEQLSSPPIFEVICGLIFDPIAELTPVTLGPYWARKKAAYPQHQIHPALADEPTLVMGTVPPMRVWLVSKDDEFVLQIQPERFYLNWRARGRDYPRFRDHGASKGILSRMMAEFTEFEEFCRDAYGQVPSLRRLELAKVDHFVEGKHWNGFQDLARLVPWLQSASTFAVSADPTVALRFIERRDGRVVSASVDTTRTTQEDGRAVRVLKMETRVARELPSKEAVEELFRGSNEELNELFGKLLPHEERQRFR